MKHYIMLFAFFCLSVGAKAQQQGAVALNLYGGYTFQDRVNFSGAYGLVKDGFQYGGGLEYYLHSSKSLELKYLRMDTYLPLYGAGGIQLNKGADKGSVNYILIGGNNYFGSSQSKAMPYGGADLGVGIVSLKDGGSATKFGWDAKLGVKINTSSAVSIKLQAYIQSIISGVSTGFYYYPGGAVVAADYASIFQFGLGGALCFNFKHH